MKNDIIKLLPASVANQIAAGEVVQRPASAVKELLENAIDSGATEIKLIIKDAGRSLIQVTDNGKGMSETDARLCFERHATSKLHKAEDLFAIRTMGFRGEALASIAAIAQVELKTRRPEDEIGSEVLIEGSVFKSQTPCSCAAGTTISVKNLFFNTPARRNFLKADITEFNHILEEFNRVALVHKDINFHFYNQGKEVFRLYKSILKQRISSLFGQAKQEQLVAVEQSSELVHIYGFIGKPESARKTRGEQYFFVNNRFIRHPYFHHAIESAYRELIPENFYPGYFIYLEVDPATLDVNIHPTKTEVKFLNDKLIYSILQSAVKMSLGKFSLMPSLDFDSEPLFDYKPMQANTPVQPPQIKLNPDYNPFGNSGPAADPLRFRQRPAGSQQWEKLYEGLEQTRIPDAIPEIPEGNPEPQEETVDRKLFQLKNEFILCAVKSGLMLIDQQRAHERILYERHMQKIENQEILSQQLLFPQEVILTKQDASLIFEIKDDLRNAGISIENSIYHDDAFMVTGVPTGSEDINPQLIIEELLEIFKSDTFRQASRNSKFALALSKSLSVKSGTILKEEEMNKLVDELFSCQLPEQSPDGKRIISLMKMEDIRELFK